MDNDDFNNFIHMSFKNIMPHNEVELSYSHLKDEGVEHISNYNDFVDKFAMLSNVKSDKLMNVYMHQLHLFNAILPFAKRDKQIALLLDNLFHRWKSELSLTRAYNGTERKLQDGAARPQILNGYGEETEREENKENSSKSSSWFNKIIPGGK